LWAVEGVWWIAEGEGALLALLELAGARHHLLRLEMGRPGSDPAAGSVHCAEATIAQRIDLHIRAV